MIRSLLLGCSWFVLIPAASLFSQSTPIPPRTPLEEIDFDQHVQPLLSKLGCNSGSCHGNSAGKGGLKLSLFGSDPLLDFKAITDEDHGRVDRQKPSESLFLQKPTKLVEHGGGVRFAVESFEYEVIRSWIAKGAMRSHQADPLRSLEVTPSRCRLTKDDAAQSLSVVATWESGKRSDVTQYCSWRVTDEIVAELRQSTIRPLQPGTTVVVATYAGWSANASILVPQRTTKLIEAKETVTSSSNRIDELIEKQLRDLNIVPATICDESTFLRRLRLATLGSPPNVEAIKSFLADRDPLKRERVIDEYLCNSIHASLLATRMCEITGSQDLGNSENQPERNVESKWHAWFQARFERNEPYDSMVRHILTATTREELSADRWADDSIEANAEGRLNDPQCYANKATMDLFWQRRKVNEEVDVESLAERVAAAFLGVRIECAKCHKHPFDRWTQDDYRSFTNLFTQVRFGLSGDARIAIADKLQQQREATPSNTKRKSIPALHEIYISNKPIDFRGVGNSDILLPRPLGGESFQVGGDRRKAFADWLLAKTNPYFARNVVNRIWGLYFGIGLIEPMDAYSASNPPSNSELLDSLAREFIESGFDIRRLEKSILSSQAWQRSAESDPSNSAGSELYARFRIQILPAHAIVDSLANAFHETSTPTATLPTVASGREDQQPYFDLFSRPERKSRCDCERRTHPTLRQAMLLLSDPGLSKRIDKSVEGLLSDKDLKEPATTKGLIEQLFLSALARFPNHEEHSVAQEHFANVADEHRAAADILWSLVNTREFVTLH